MAAGAGDVRLQLGVTLDLASFRQQLAAASRAAASFSYPINFDKASIDRQFAALDRQFKRRNYRLEVITNFAAEIDNADKLVKKIEEVKRAAQSSGPQSRSVGLVDVAALGRIPSRGGPSKDEIAALYESLAIAGVEGFERGTKKTRDKMVAQIGTVGQDILAGLLNGLSSQDAALKAAAENLGMVLIKTFKALLGIASPSRVFREFGKNVGEGFEQGATASMDKAFDALERQLRQRLAVLQGMMSGGRGAFPFVAKTGPIEQKALFAESANLARKIDQTRAEISQIQARRESRLGFQRESLAQAAGRILPPARDRSLPAARAAIFPQGTATEQALQGFFRSLKNAQNFFAKNFSANTYLSKASRQLATSMGESSRLLRGQRIAGLLPSSEMLEPLKFQRAIQAAQKIDVENAAKARRGSLGQFPMEGMMGPSRSVDRSFSNYITAEFTRMMKAGALGGGFPFPNAPMMGPSSALPPRGSLGRFPLDPMLSIGGPSALGQAMAGPTPWYNTSLGARGGFVPGVRSSAFFPMNGMMGPSSPLGRITGQSSMFAGGAGGGGGRPPGGRDGGASFGDFGRALGKVQLPGSGAIREIGTEFAFATKQVLLFGQAYKLLAFLQDFPSQVGAAVGQLQSFRNTLSAISPTAKEAAVSNEFILGIVERYNIPLQSARDGFTKLYASMAPAGFKGEEIRGLFTGISQAAATFGMSADKVDRVNYAFAQMASKGQVMSEELKGQLGDVLPGSMAIFAKAAGFEGPEAISKFSKALEDGAYKGDAMKQLLLNVGVVMRKEFGKGAEGAALTFQGVINRLQNSMRLLYESFEPVAVGFLNTVVMPLTGGIKTVTDGFNAFFTNTKAKTAGGAAFAQSLSELRPVLEGIASNAKQLLPIFSSFASAALSAGKILLQLAGNPVVGYLARLYSVVLLLNTAFTLLGGRILLGLAIQIASSVARFAALNTALVLSQINTLRLGTSLAGTRIQMGLLTAGVATFGNTLRAVMVKSVVGIAIVALGVLAERFIMAGVNADQARQKMQQFADSVKSMGDIGDIAGASIALGEQRALAKRLRNAEALLKSLQSGKKSVSPQQANELKTLGLASNMAFVQEAGQRNLTVQTMPGAIEANAASAAQGYLDTQTRILQAERALAAARSRTQKDNGKIRQITQQVDEKAANKEAVELNRLLQEELRLNTELNIIGKDELSQLESKIDLAGQLLTLQLKEIDLTEKGAVRDQARNNALLAYKKIVALAQQEWANTIKEIDGIKLKAEELADKITGKNLPDKTPFQQALIDIKAETIDNIQAADALLKRFEALGGRRPEYKQLADSLGSIRDFAAKITPEQQAEAARQRLFESLRKPLRGELDQMQQAGLAPSTERETQLQLFPSGIEPSSARGKELLELARQIDLARPFAEMAEAVGRARNELTRLTDIKTQIVTMGDAIGSSFGNAFKGMVNGSMTAQQALGSFFQSVADSFLDMAAQMIAKWIQMQIIGLAQSLLPGLGGLGSFAGGAKFGGSVGLPSGVNMGAGNGIIQNTVGQGFGTLGPNFGFRQFATGGIVTGPTLGLVGEGRFNEAIVPLPNGKSIPVDLGDGAGNNISTNIVINVGNGQAQSSMTGGGASDLGRKMEGAVKQVIVNELRPGGLLSGGRR